MGVRNYPIKNKFLLISVIAFIVIGALIYPITKSQLENFLLTQAQTEFQQTVQDKAASVFNLELSISLKLSTNISSFVQELGSETKATDIKFFDSDGAVLYSPARAEIGQDFSGNQEIKEAISGNEVTENFNPNNLTVTEFVPIESTNGDVRGVISANAVLPQGLKFINTFAFELDGLIGLLLLFFIGAIYLFLANAESDMIEKDHSLVDQSRAFEEEEQLDNAIINSMDESLVVINKDGQIVLFNPATELLTGYKASEVEYRLYLKFLTFYDKDGQALRDNPITKVLKTGESVEILITDHYFFKGLNKKLVPVLASIAPILNKDKKIQGVVATIQDASTEVELNKVKDEYVYVVAHELGNPIFTLDGYLGLLQDGNKKFDAGTKEIIETARSINRQLSELVNDLLEVVRNEQGTLRFDLGPVDLSEITEIAVSNAQMKAKEKNIKLNFKNAKLPKAIANEQKIKEVITNLIDNAIKYTPSGGKIEVWSEQKDGEIFTHVQDNGFGIKKEDQEKLFEKFYRVRTPKTADISGTGLGLFICRQIIEKCNGKIEVSSEENKGSIFSFVLKIAK